MLVYIILADMNEFLEYIEVAKDRFSLYLPSQDNMDVVVTTLIDIYMQVHQ